MTLSEFLFARIAEMEQTLADWDIELRGIGGTTPPAFNVRHRVLADCKVQSAIVELHAPRRQDPQWKAMGQLPVCAECGSDVAPRTWPCRTLRALALPYADHPDYREEWKVA